MRYKLVKNYVKKKSKLHYTRGITPKRVTSDGVHLRGLAPGQVGNAYSFGLRGNIAAVASHCLTGNTKSNLTGPGNEPQTSGTDSDVGITESTGRSRNSLL